MPDLTTVLANVIDYYPEPLQPTKRLDMDRQSYQLETVRRLVPPHGRVLDIGGGVSLFSAGCAALGYDTTMVDDNQDAIHAEFGQEAFSAHRRYGVKLIERDVIADGLALHTDYFDMVTCFDSMEHWHASPKALFHQVVDVLRPGGWFFLGVPNSLNLRKRFAVPLGRAKWSQMADWYEQPIFRGHVREPDVADLRYIAKDMGLIDVQVDGRNWLGLNSPRPEIAKAARLLDRALRQRPQLCSDIYLLGRTPA